MNKLKLLAAILFIPLWMYVFMMAIKLIVNI